MIAGAIALTALVLRSRAIWIKTGSVDRNEINMGYFIRQRSRDGELVMPRFYFNVCCGDRLNDRDELGQELPDRRAAWEVATRYAGDSLRDLDGDLQPDDDWRLEVQTEDGARVFQISIRASLG